MRIAKALIGIALGLSLLGGQTAAQSIDSTLLQNDLNSVSGGALMNMFSGGGTYFQLSGGCTTPSSCLALQLVEFLSNTILLLVSAIATLFVVRAGIALVVSEGDDKLQKAKRQITGVIVALVLIFLSQKMLQAFYFPGGAYSATNMSSIVNEEVGGIIYWVLTIVPIVAMAMIVIGGIKAIASFGKEDGVGDMRKTLFAIICGLVLLMSNEAIVLTLGVSGGSFASAFVDLGSPDANPIILRAFGIASDLLKYLALAAVGIIVYGAIMLIIRWGSEDQMGATKKLIGRVLIGLFVVFVSYMALIFVMYLIA